MRRDNPHFSENTPSTDRDDLPKYRSDGLLVRGIGGLYTVHLDADDTPLGGKYVDCRACGGFRHDGIKPLCGDRVTVTYTNASFSLQDGTATANGTDTAITQILPRKNALIRPPLANLDLCFVCIAAASPAPMTDMTDKLLCILEHNHIEPILVIGKCELDPERAKEIADIYRRAGFTVFPLSCHTKEGIQAPAAYIKNNLDGKIAAFAGASGVGKSTLINTLFPTFSLQTGGISQKIQRGKHTTRAVELFPLAVDGACGYLADTPGFSMLDFMRFDFFTKEDLPDTFREFAPYLGQCRYTRCTHQKEEGCAVLHAVQNGIIPPSRHQSYCALYEILKDKHPWDK